MVGRKGNAAQKTRREELNMGIGAAAITFALLALGTSGGARTSAIIMAMGLGIATAIIEGGRNV
jgi:hypothetical protein